MKKDIQPKLRKLIRPELYISDDDTVRIFYPDGRSNFLMLGESAYDDWTHSFGEDMSIYGLHPDMECFIWHGLEFLGYL